MPQHLQKSINQGHLENGTYEQIVSHLKRIWVEWFESIKFTQINTVTQHAKKPNPEKPKPTCHHCKKPGYSPALCRQLKREKDQNESNKNSAGKNNINNGGRTNFNPSNKNANNSNANNTKNRNDKRLRIVYPPCETCGKTNHPTEKWYLEPMQQVDCLLGIEDQRYRIRINGRTPRIIQLEVSRLRPELEIRNAQTIRN